jgi:hypothetical protein
MERISFTVLLETAADTVTTAQHILSGPANLVGTIGRRYDAEPAGGGAAAVEPRTTRTGRSRTSW